MPGRVDRRGDVVTVVCQTRRASSVRRSGQLAAQAPCWEVPGTAWRLTGCCLYGSPTYLLRSLSSVDPPQHVGTDSARE